jgi:hypothetical protein
VNENDLKLNWSHYNHLTNLNLQRGTGLNNFIQDELTSAAFFSDVANSLKIKWDAVNLEVGKSLDFNNQSIVRFHGGLQYANIQTINANSSSSVNTANDVNEYINISDSNTTMSYNGFGPRVGMDLFHNLNKAFSVYGKAATTLLIGSNKFNQFVAGSYTTAASNIYTLTGPFNIASSGSNTKLVPELDAALGVNYTYSMIKSSLSIDAGWIWANYFDAQGASASPNGLESRGLPMQTKLSFQIQGGYLGLQWHGDMV